MSEVIDFMAAKARRQQTEKKNLPELKNCMSVFQFCQDQYRFNNYEWQSLLMKLIVKLEQQEKLTHEEFLKHIQDSVPRTPEAS